MTTPNRDSETTMNDRLNLFPAGHSALCQQGHRCPEATTAHLGRHFITFGHCGFNSGPNNADGYATESAARKAIFRHEVPAFRATIEAAHLAARGA